MKHFILILFSLSLLLIRCTEKSEPKALAPSVTIDSSIQIPDVTVDISTLHFNNKISVWTKDGQPYSGYAVSFHQDSILKEKMGVFNGKKQNQSKLWFPDGHIKEIANYHKGYLHKEKKVWHVDGNHVLISQLNYESGTPHGEQKIWYPTGELHKILHLDMGLEVGVQQAFRENGDLYANYESKNGRVFGLNRGELCFGLKDQKIQYEK